jgi:hypothetical protein
LFRYLFTFWLRCGFWFPCRRHALGDGGSDGADFDTTEVQDEDRRPVLFGHPHFLDDGDEPGLRKDFIADVEAGQLVALLPLVLLNWAEESKVEEDGYGSGIGQREDEDSFHGVIQVSGTAV